MHNSRNRSNVDTCLKSLLEHEAIHAPSYDLIEPEPAEVSRSTKPTIVVPDVTRASSNFPNITGTGTGTVVKQESAEIGPRSR